MMTNWAYNNKKLGELFKNKRTDLVWTIRTLAQDSGISNYTISKAENGLSAITMETVVKLCHSLGINFSEFGLAVLDRPIKESGKIISELPKDIFFLEESDINHYFEALVENTVVLRIDELENLTQFVNSRPDQSNVILNNWRDEILSLPDLNGIPAHPFADNLDITDIGSLSERVEENIFYLPTLTDTFILESFQRGAVILPADVAQYIKARRYNLSFSLASLETDVGRSDNFISLLENNALTQIKLNGIVAINNILSINDEILSMYWAAYEFQSGIANYHSKKPENPITNTKDGKVVANFLVYFSRWLSCLGIQKRQNQ